MFDDDESGPAERADDANPAGSRFKPAEVGDLPLARLESDICTLAGHLAAATCRWLLLVGEFDRRQAWASWGARSCAQWLSWRCGMGGGTAREHVRVGRALLEFPRIRAAFGAGTLTYSKVRALTRIASPELEEELVNLALGTTAAQVDRVVRTYRRAADSETPPLPSPATLRSSWNDDGTLTVTVRLGSDEGALLLAGLDAYDEILQGERRSDAGKDRDASGGSQPSVSEPPCPQLEPQRRANGPVAMAEALLAMVSAALAHGPNDASGADRFQVVLHADVDQLAMMAGTEQDDDHDGATYVDEAAAAETQPTTAGRRKPLARGRCHVAGGPAVYPETLRRLACDAQIRLMSHGPDGSPRDVGRRHRLVTAALRALLEERDHGRCRFPACQRRRRLHAHHIVHWADGGPTDLSNLVLLCPFHHQLVHEHGFSMTIDRATLTFHRPDGTAIDASPPTTGDPALDHLDPRLHAAPPVTDETTTPEWWGDPMHVLDAVDGLLRRPEAAAHSDVPAGTSDVWVSPWTEPGMDTAEAA